MKHIVISILLILSFKSYSQTILPLDSLSGKVSYSKVVFVDTVIAGDLYRRAKSWFVESYGSGKDVIQNDDPSVYTIQGKGSFTANYTSMGIVNEWGKVSYIITIACKDGKYKYNISHFFHELTGYPAFSIGEITNTMSATGKSMRQKDVDGLKEQVQSNSEILIESLRKGMLKPLLSKSEW